MVGVVMRMHRHWEIRCPPCQMHMVGGKFVPTVKGIFSGRLMQKKRRISIEIYGPPKEEPDKKSEPAPKRGLSRATENEASMNVVDLSSRLEDDDRVVIRILKPRKTWGLSRDPDDSSDSEHEETNEDLETEDGWVEYRRYDLDEIQDEKFDGDDWEATVGRGNNKERREIKFENKQQAKEFVDELTKLRQHVKDRAAARLEAFKKKQAEAAEALAKQKPKKTSDGALIKARDASSFLEMDKNDYVNLLVEIVSATDLPIADSSSTDAYIVVFLANQELHRTETISKNLDPIWTVDNGSLFIVSMKAEDFFHAAAGLSFVIKDYDSLSSNETLGRVDIPQIDLLSQTGGRFEYDINVLGGLKTKKSHFKPKINLRIRKAEKYDFKFMKQLHAIKKSKMKGVYADKSFLAPHAESVSFLSRDTMKGSNGETLHRTKPRPDPSRPEDDTKWMTRDQIETETMLPSTNWLKTGSGTVGEVYFEVLKCNKLPNMDAAGGGKTDAFCCIIFEDAIVNTDVINDELSPRWMPWSQRAFLFKIAHPSSQILLGVFDFDAARKIDDHDPIGRISIDMTNFRVNTTYLLTYDLHSSVLNKERKKFGTITVRLRINYNSYRDYVKGSLSLPPENYINVPKKQDFKTSHFVVHGEENLERLNMKAIQSFREELEEYSGITYYIIQGAMTVLLWRGHFPVNLCGLLKFKLPLHSILAFVMGVTLVENFDLFPSYWLFSIAWILIASNEARHQNPSPWHGSMRFRQMWYAVITGKAPGIEIADHENEAAIRKFEEARNKRLTEEAKKRAEAAEATNQLTQFLTNETQDIEDDMVDENFSTKVGGGPTLNPLAPILFPIQTILASVCKGLRIASSIVLWDESIYAFIITNLCLAAGIALIWVPWGFVLRWTVRIVLWVVLGPWMKLLDIFYVRKLEEDGDNNAKKLREMASANLNTIVATKRNMMIVKERVLKLSAMKRYMFGKYVTRVPQFKEYRFPDVPLPESTATPIEEEEWTKVNVQNIKHGQQLIGDMIPVWGDASDDNLVENEAAKAE